MQTPTLLVEGLKIEKGEKRLVVEKQFKYVNTEHCELRQTTLAYKEQVHNIVENSTSFTEQKFEMFLLQTAGEETASSGLEPVALIVIIVICVAVLGVLCLVGSVFYIRRKRRITRQQSKQSKDSKSKETDNEDAASKELIEMSLSVMKRAPVAKGSIVRSSSKSSSAANLMLSERNRKERSSSIPTKNLMFSPLVTAGNRTSNRESRSRFSASTIASGYLDYAVRNAKRLSLFRPSSTYLAKHRRRKKKKHRNQLEELEAAEKGEAQEADGDGDGKDDEEEAPSTSKIELTDDDF